MSNFDPFQKAWQLYDEGGNTALTTREAPLMVYNAAPAMAENVAARYKDQGLRPMDLRFMIIPDAQPVAPVHLVVVGGRQVAYRGATAPERAAMDELTLATEEHLLDVMDLSEHGVGVYRFGRIPTMHHHVVGREEYGDGLDWTNRVPLVGLEERREVRERVAFEQTPGRLEEVAARVSAALARFA